MTASPSCSILIPAHNAQQWIEQAVQSARGQGPGEQEILVVDDGSTDRTPQMLDASRDFVGCQHTPHRGGNHARNVLLHNAHGAWLQFLDADDYLLPQKVTIQMREAGDALADADILYSPVLTETWRDEQPTERHATGINTSLDLYTQWLFWQLPQTGGALWRRRALLDIGGWKEGQPCCQEHELYLRAIKSGLRFIYCPTPGAVYRIWSEKTVCRKDPLLVIREKTALIDDMLSWLHSGNRLHSCHKDAAGQVCFEMARTWAKYDLSGASTYFNQRRHLGLIHPVGPAAPRAYRLALKTLGFRHAEKIAARLR